MIAQTTLGVFVAGLPLSAAQRTLLRARLQGSYGTELERVMLRGLGFGACAGRGGGEVGDGHGRTAVSPRHPGCADALLVLDGVRG